MQLREQSADYVAPELFDAAAPAGRSFTGVSISQVLVRLMRPPRYLASVSLWGMGLCLLAIPVLTPFLSRLGQHMPDLLNIALPMCGAALLIWYMSALSIAGARLSQLTNIEAQSNAVCGHEILLAPITDHEVLGAIVRSHWPSVFLAGLLPNVALGVLSILGPGQPYFVDNLGLLAALVLVGCTLCPLGALLWILIALLLLRRVSQRMKPVWMTALTVLLTYFALGGLYGRGSFSNYYNWYEQNNALIVGGVAVCMLLLYLTIRFLGLPRRRVARNSEVWIAFILTSVAGILFLGGTTPLEFYSFDWNIPFAALLCFSPWNSLPLSIYDGNGLAIKSSFFLVTLAAQLIWLRLLWPLALEVIRESRAPQ